MKQVFGNKLSLKLQRQVLNAFGYRWTFENMTRAKQWYRGLGLPAIPPTTDAQWLACTEFWVTDKGELSRKHRYCHTHR